MRIGNKIKIIVVLIFIVSTNIITYNIATKRVSFNMFLSDISYDFILLKAIDANRSSVIKTILTNNIKRAFYEAEKTEEIKIFLPLCKYITEDNLKVLDKHSFFNDYTDFNLSLMKKYNKLNIAVKIGREKIINLCNNKNKVSKIIQ